MRSKAMRFMQQMIDLARLPHVQATVLTGKFQEEIQKAPTADLNVFGLPPELDFDKIRKTIKMMDSTCLFVLDSGIENVTA
jgi:hypothetical protein